MEGASPCRILGDITLPVFLGSLSASIAICTIPTLLLAIPVWRFMSHGLMRGSVKE